MKKFLSLMLCAALTLCAFAAYAENAELNIATNQYYALMERMEQFEQESGISITCEKSVGIMDTISTAYVIKNPDIDLFVFTAYDGLYTLKNMKYYAPLTGSAILQDAFQHVYPALRPVCTDDDTLILSSEVGVLPIDPTKITNALGWYPETKFEDGIVKTIVWYLENQDWVEEVTSGDYQGYYEKMYGK